MRAPAAAAFVVCAACQVQPDGPSFTVVGESVTLRWQDALPARSAYFDGRVVHLRGVRGETLGLQAVREGQRAVAMSLAIDGAAVTAFAVDFHDVRLPSTVMYGGSRGPGLYPDRLRPVTGALAARREAYFDVAIARDAAPGHHAGELAVGDARYPVELEVERAVLPDPGAAPWLWAYYDPREIAGAHHSRGDAATLAIERGYAALFRDHGVVATPELTLASWPARAELVRGLAYLPVVLPRDPAGLIEAVQGWAARLAGTGQVAFAIPIDEPRSIAAQLRVRVLAARVRAAGGGPGRFLFAVTHEPSWLLGGDVDVFLSARSPGPGAWVYNGTPPDAGSMVVDGAGGGLRSWGWIGFRYRVALWYVWDALYWHDRHNRRGVLDAAAAASDPADASSGDDLLEHPVTFDDGDDHGNLDGVLVYPGPRPSLRLKALRRGLEDRALLELYAACAGDRAAAAIAAEVVPRALAEARRGDRAPWPADELGWEAARARVLDGLAACAAPP